MFPSVTIIGHIVYQENATRNEGQQTGKFGERKISPRIKKFRQLYGFQKGITSLAIENLRLRVVLEQCFHMDYNCLPQKVRTLLLSSCQPVQQF